jgi:hypothetical protein
VDKSGCLERGWFGIHWLRFIGHFAALCPSRINTGKNSIKAVGIDRSFLFLAAAFALPLIVTNAPV